MTLELRLSGGAGNSDPNGSLGGVRSSTVVTSDVLDNLFDSISRAEALQVKTEFRCIYVYNTGAGHLSGVTAEISVNPTVTIASIGLDPSGKGDGVNTGVATTISTEDTVPSTVKFFGEDDLAPVTDGPFKFVKVPIGLLFSGEGVPIWFKRVTETGGVQTITFDLTITHDAVTLPGSTIDDGGAIGELAKVTKQVAGTFKIGFTRVGFASVP